MSRIDHLLTRFRTHVSQPLKSDFPLSQRIWFVVYPPEDERRLEPRLPEFELATKDAGLEWVRIEISGSFAAWLDSRDDKDEIMGDPELVETYADPGYVDFVKSLLTDAVTQQIPSHLDRTVFALTGLMELYDFVHVSSIMDALDSKFPGVLLLFFPGERENNTYRFLGARDGWDYLAVPILTES